jgi:PLP dependent protein
LLRLDSLKLLKEINKEAEKNSRIIDVLLQVYIAQEETKFGLDEEELNTVIRESANLNYINIKGLMGMASFCDDLQKLRGEFRNLKTIFDKHNQLSVLSMGMSGDYKIAIEEGSTMVRIGSLLFGTRK